MVYIENNITFDKFYCKENIEIILSYLKTNILFIFQKCYYAPGALGHCSCVRLFKVNNIGGCAVLFGHSFFKPFQFLTVTISEN